VREALFDILGARILGACFLDAYAGTGAVGIEALSRGARRAVFLERDRRALVLIRENLAVGPWLDASEILGGDVAGSLSLLSRRAERFQVAFLDPPYDVSLAAGILEQAVGLVEEGGVIVVEHRSSARIDPGAGAAIAIRRSYRYGETVLTVIRRGPEQPVPR
jgi:16S rRNA (guanine(966)-N(2))-methyltransferase RsmD